MLHITLTLPPDPSAEQWAAIDEVFRRMPGWAADDDGPAWRGRWLGAPYRVEGTIEPSGLVLESDLPPDAWTGWVSVICARLSCRLGVEVHDAEMPRGDD